MRVLPMVEMKYVSPSAIRILFYASIRCICALLLDVFCSMFSLSIILIAFEATVFHYFNKSHAIYQENSNSKYMYVYVNFDLHWNKSTLRRIKFTKTTNVQNRFEWMSNKNRIALFYWIIVRYFIFDIFIWKWHRLLDLDYIFQVELLI